MGVECKFAPALAIDGRNARAVPANQNDTEHAVRARAEAFDDAGFVALFGRREASEYALANADGRTAALFATGADVDEGRFLVGFPALWTCQQLAVGVLSRDLEHGDFGQLARLLVAAPAAAAD